MTEEEKQDAIDNPSDYPDDFTKEETPEENITPQVDEPEKAEKSEKEIKSLLAQKEHWRKKYEEASKTKVEAKPEPKPSVSNEDEWKHKVEFLLENRDVTEEEFDHLAAVALRRSGSVTTDSLKDAQKQESDYISYTRKKLEDKKKVPGSTSTGFVSKVKSAKEIAKMSNDEFKEYEASLISDEGKTGI